jgi:hypothetical protein
MSSVLWIPEISYNHWVRFPVTESARRDGALYNYTVAKVTMDCDFRMYLFKTTAEENRRISVSYGHGGVDRSSETTTEFRDGLYVRIVQTDTTIKIGMMDQKPFYWPPIYIPDYAPDIS